jgi:hypothetical protein
VDRQGRDAAIAVELRTLSSELTPNGDARSAWRVFALRDTLMGIAGRLS